MNIYGELHNAIFINTSNIEQPLFFDLGINRLASAANYRHFLGNIDDIKIWTVAKSSDEISNEYLHEQSGTEQFLFSNYKFDVVSDTIFDCSFQKNHGKRFGTAGTNFKTKFSTDFPQLTDVDCGIGFTGTNETELKKANQIAIYPNPTSEEITIILDNTEQTVAHIISNDGRFIQKFKIMDGTKMISTNQLPIGLYELRVISAACVSIAKFIKQ
jgi:hypothetical protein